MNKQQTIQEMKELKSKAEESNHKAPIIDEDILDSIGEERMCYDWRGRTTWEGDERPERYKQMCVEYARWYISRYLQAAFEQGEERC